MHNLIYYINYKELLCTLHERLSSFGDSNPASATHICNRIFSRNIIHQPVNISKKKCYYFVLVRVSQQFSHLSIKVLSK